MLTNRIIPKLQILLISAMGWKMSQRAQICYKSGETNEMPVRIANHVNFPATGVYPGNTGRVTLTVEDAYWQGDKLQITEVRNSDPNALGMDTADDGGVWSNVHGYAFENLPAGSHRDFLIRVNGTGLTFSDVRELITLVYPSPA